MARKPSEAALRCEAVIAEFIEKHGESPTYDEIAKILKTSTPSARGLVLTLLSYGRVEVKPGYVRSIRLVKPPLEEAA